MLTQSVVMKIYIAPFGVKLKGCFASTQRQSAAFGRVEIGCILSKDRNLSSAACADIIHAPGLHRQI